MTPSPAHFTPTRFPIRFDPWYAVMSSALFLSPAKSFVNVGHHQVDVRMAWGFRASFPRSAVRATSVVTSNPISRGVHGFGGRWLVNGAGDRVLQVDLSLDGRAYVMGFPVSLRQLQVSVDDPAALAAALKP